MFHLVEHLLDGGLLISSRLHGLSVKLMAEKLSEVKISNEKFLRLSIALQNGEIRTQLARFTQLTVNALAKSL